MPIRRSQYQDPDYVPQDLFELAEEEEREEEERQAWHAGESDRLEQRIERAARGYYLDLRRNKKLTHNRAALAVDPEGRYYQTYNNMAASTGKKTYTKKAGAAKVTKAKVVSKGKTPGTGKVDHSKAIKAAVDKALSKTIETQHAYQNIVMNTSTRTLSGLRMSPLNGEYLSTDKDGNTLWKFVQDRVFATNLSGILQVRGQNATSASGYRVGFKTNVLSIRVDIRGIIVNPHVECKFHALLARRKDGTRPPYYTPTIINFNESALWRKNDSGAYAYSAFHTDFPTMDKRNTEVWSFPTGGHVEKSVPPVSLSNTGRMFQLSMYKEIKDVWEFNTELPKADNNLKDGDYCLFIFREGVEDTPSATSNLTVSIDIAFKDT
jgi:hypothetical protein